MENRIIENMLKTALQNIIVRKLKEGDLVLNNESIEVKDNNNNLYFLTYCPYSWEGVELNKKYRNKLNLMFIEKYTYKNIIDIFAAAEEEKRQKAIKAESNKYLLENLLNDISILKNYGNIEILADNHLIQYYISFKRNYNYKLDIYLTDSKDIFNIKYNYEKSQVNKEELKTLINSIVTAAEKEIEEEKKQREEEQKEKDIYNKRLEFAKRIIGGEVAIVKLKSSYQCLEKNRRYAVGTGKSGKFYSLKGLSGIMNYLESKNINQYIFIKEDQTYNLNNEILKSFNYSNIS